MKILIEVESKEEARLIRTALADKETRALVKVIGTLLPLKSDRTRVRVLKFAADSLAENAEGW